MPAVPKHRQPIVDAALSLFRRRGYAATGLNEIVDASGAPKGSLYHYFPVGKVSIAAAAVEEAGRRITATATQLANENDSTAQMLRAHARVLGGWMRQSRFRSGCPLTTVLLALAPEDRAVAEAGRQAYSAWTAILVNKLIADGFAHARAQDIATLCISMLQGALIQARVLRSGAPIETAATELARMLEAAQQVAVLGAERQRV